MRVLYISPFDYITLSPWLSSLFLMMSLGQQSRCFESSVRQLRLHSELLTAYGQAGAAGSGGRPAGRQTQR